MTPTTSGSNYSIKSSYKSKRWECQPRGEAQMEDSRASTSFQMLARTFETLLESPEDEITAIPSVRYDQHPTSRSRDIPVSLQELESLDSNVCDRVSPADKSLVEKQENFVRGSEAVGPKEGKKPCGSSSSLHKKQYPSKITTHRKEIPKEQPEGQETGKAQIEEALPSEVQNSKERKDRGPSQGFYANVLQRKSPEDKGLVEKQKNFVRGPEERVGSKEGQQPLGSSSSLDKKKYT
ncbi:hypothetical protein O181_010600 [Austropuccinia psidii MF-1]|uniref:Uncharacterized protein n=1 Tax=Austropuccinia psidii MF-1 TaxID=1389203 RepID=A0A9Q3BTI8_9BASI|nr:hypothetical protein [Austropuccinia psidii MF-1]